MKTEALRFEKVSAEDLRFGGLLNATFCVYTGETVAVAGLLQSGKKSLLSILSGKLQKYEGKIFVHGEEVYLGDAKAINRYGIASIGDSPLLLNNLNVMDNICLPKGHRSLFSLIDNQIEDELTQWLFNELQPEVFKKEISQLTNFEKIKIEILKVVYGGARILVFSSAFMYLNDNETNEIYHIIQRLNAFGVSVILETDNDYIFFEDLIDRVLIIRNGITTTTVYKGKDGRFDQNRIRHVIVGHAYNRPESADEYLPPKEVIADYLKIQHRTKDTVFNIARSSIIGIFDSDERLPKDADELIKLFSQHFQIIIEDKLIEPKSISDLIDHRIAIITKEFENDLICNNLSPVDNVCMQANRIFGKGLVYQKRTARYLYKNVMRKYKVLRHCVDLIDRPNCFGLTYEQQYELMVAKWLAYNPDIIIIYAPLFNHDIKNVEAYRELQVSLSHEGKIIIIIASNEDYLRDFCLKVFEI